MENEKDLENGQVGENGTVSRMTTVHMVDMENVKVGRTSSQSLENVLKQTPSRVKITVNRNNMTPEDVFTDCMEHVCKQLHLLEEAVKSAPNTKREVKAEVLMIGKAVKRLANAAFLSRRVKVTADHETQTAPEVRGSAQTEELVRTTANSDAECQTPCWWEMQLPITRHVKQKLQQAQDTKSKSRKKKMQDGNLTVVEKPASGENFIDVEEENPDNAGADPAHSPAEWTEVVKKGKKKSPPTQNVLKEKKEFRKVPRRTNEALIALLRKRVPKSAAVTIGKPTVEGTTLSSVMKKVATEVNLKSLGIEVKNTRRTNAGGILLELNTEEDADLLADQIRRTLGPTTRVDRPSRTTPVLILDIPEWTDEEELRKELIREGVVDDALTAESVKINIRTNPGARGDRIARVDIPVPTAIRLAKSGHVKVGWTRCRVKLLERKQPTCFRCQERGHIAAQCKGALKERQCYRCFRPGHIARDCTEQRPNSSKKRTQHLRKSSNSQERRSGLPIHNINGIKILAD